LDNRVVVCFDGVDVVKGVGVFRMNFVKLLDIFLIVFGLFLAYQMILYLLGGSWTMDAITLGLQFVIITILWVLSFEVVKIRLKLDGHFKWHARNVR